MITEIEIARLKVEPDEVLIMWLPVETSADDVGYLIDAMSRTFVDKQVRYLVLPETIRLEVVKHVEN